MSLVFVDQTDNDGDNVSETDDDDDESGSSVLTNDDEKFAFE